MRVEKAQKVLAKVEEQMAYWQDAIRNARNQADREMFYELYKVQSHAARAIEDRLDRM